MYTTIPGVPRIPVQVDANGNVLFAPVPVIQPILPILVSARCRLRFMVTSVANHYHDSIVNDQTPQNMNYTLILNSFYSEYEAILNLSKKAKPDVLILYKNSTLLKWMESIKDYLYRTYGLRKTPFLYVFCEVADVLDEVSDPLFPNKGS